MLGRERNLQRGIQDQWLQAAAEHMGSRRDLRRHYQGISFADCIACGQCITGCPHGAKNSTDLTYLAQAEDLGAQILPFPRRTSWFRCTMAGESLSANPLTSRSPASRPKRSLWPPGSSARWSCCRRARPLEDAARTVVDARATVRTNSEAFSAILHPPGTDVTHGATISSDFYPNPDTHVTNNRFPKSYGFMRWYLSPFGQR